MPFLLRTTLAAITAANASAVCAVCAQSNLTIYGRINHSLEHQSVGTQSVNVMAHNNSRIGFHGREDLGQGHYAGFLLEGGVQSDTGAGMQRSSGFAFDRKSFVYIGGHYGMVKMGFVSGSSYDFVADYGVLDQPNHDTGSASDALYYDLRRGNNSIVYTAPTIHGVTLEAAISLHEKDPLSEQKNVVDLSANWVHGPWSVGAGWTDRAGNRQSALRVQYTHGDFQIGAYYQRVHDAAWGIACNTYGRGCGTRASTRMAAMYTLAPAQQFVLSWGGTGDWSRQAHSSARQVTLGYNLNLSRRTKVYALYTRIHNDANTRYGTAFHSGVGYGQNARSIGVGLRHAF